MMGRAMHGFRAGRMFLSLCLGVLLCACGTGHREPIEVLKAWSPAAPPGSSVAAVYAQIVAQDADTLLGASTSIAHRVDMHETTEEAGMMQMRALEQVELLPGQPVRFEPGGMHMMLMDVHKALPPGSHFPLTLRFAKSGEISVTVVVTAPGETP